MTVSYTGDVANASGFGCFNKILLKWKGSVYKLIYKELLAYLSIFMLVNFIYREVLVKNSVCEENGLYCKEWKESREIFESLRTYCHDQLSSIPLTFVLGFYVSLIVRRWWCQYSLLPWPDSMAMYTAAFLTGKDERQRLMRRNIIRYVLLSYCMAMRSVSFRVKKRFPDLQHLVDTGLMREDELEVLTALDQRVVANKWFLPLAWATDICARALQEGNIRPQTVKCLVGELVNIREHLTGIINHDWVSVPLVYTQVVTLAVYSYFAAALIGAQWISPESEEEYKAAYGLPLGSAKAKLDLFYPFFLTIQFAFFFGWLKVAETLINPFGEDDDDFELNRLIDRHIQVGYLIVEHEECPTMMQDKYWEECIPKEIPYTVGAAKYKKEEFVGSAELSLSVKESEKVYADLPQVPLLSCNGEALPGFQFPEHEIYEEVGTPMMAKVAWLTRKMAILGSIRSFKSVSSTTSANANGLSKKPINRSQLSLYDKISRNLSIFDSHSHKGEGRSRKSSRQRSVSDVTKPKFEELSGFENKSYQKDEKEKMETANEFDYDIDLMIHRKHLETITENQNSPYSTQASQCTARRMSAQSIFPDPARRGSFPFTAPLLELFHENEMEEKFVDEREKTPEDQASQEEIEDYPQCSVVLDGFPDKNEHLTKKDQAAETSSIQETNGDQNEISTIKEKLSNHGHPSYSTVQSIKTSELLNRTESPIPAIPRRLPVVGLPLVTDMKTEDIRDEDVDGTDEEGNPVFV